MTFGVYTSAHQPGLQHGLTGVSGWRPKMGSFAMRRHLTDQSYAGMTSVPSSRHAAPLPRYLGIALAAMLLLTVLGVMTNISGVRPPRRPRSVVARCPLA